MSQMNRRCGICAYYSFAGVPLDGYSAGFCKRHAPVPVEEKYTGGHQRGQWPLVKDQDYCGDFKPGQKAFQEAIDTSMRKLP